MMPAPFFFQIQRGLPLLVMSCSQVKRPAEVRAWLRFADLYDGPTWRQLRASGFPLSNVAAISAGYGFLKPGQPIQTYDQKMDEDRSSWLCGHGAHVAQLAEAAELAGGAFVVGGGLYQELAHTAIRWRPELAGLFTFARGSYLQQRKQLGEFLRAHAPAQLQEAA